MNGKEHELDADELIRALGDIRDHASGKNKITMRTTIVPPLVDTIKAREVRTIRQRLRVSQEVFARLLNVPTVTEVSWETGRRNPSGAALRLLQVAKKRPKVLLEVAV